MKVMDVQQLTVKKDSRGGVGRLAWPRAVAPFAMPTRNKSAVLATPSDLEVEFAQACAKAVGLSRSELLAAAIVRGCGYYAPLWQDLAVRNLGWLPHEILGCALLRGPKDADTFQAIRCGAMILSDLDNVPERIAAAAREFRVAERVAHIARLGLQADQHPDFWKRVLVALPSACTEETDFLPGVSRLVAETRRSGPNQGPARIWLRTAYQR